MSSTSPVGPPSVPTAPSEREFDLVVWGASGFTGRLVAEYLCERYGVDGELAWALGGRNAKKLEALRSELGPSAETLPLIVADSDDSASLEGLAARTRVVCTTVGPYALHGSKLVEVCARSGTHYCDLTGEVQWMRRMIDAHAKQAEESGARIVHTCGFDSIPSDLGVFRLQREMRERHGVACPQVKLRVRAMSGGMSGGTIASMIQMFEEAAADRGVARVLADPYALNPDGERHGPDGPDLSAPAFDEDFDTWTGPFVMAAINTRVVRRTNALLGYAYGRDFRYDEATLLQAGPRGWLAGSAMTAGLGATALAAGFGPTRGLLKRLLPAPGTGPSQQARETGKFVLDLLGVHPHDDAHNLRLRIRGDRDPGYGSTAKMLGEAAVCLARDELAVGGGFWTPASAMGDPLLARLEQNAGVRFTLDD